MTQSEAVIILSIVNTLKEMKEGEGGSKGLYETISSKEKTFDKGFQFAIDLIEGTIKK